ncbi:MAG: hypothetical protein ACREMY_02335 [bacterium]
MMQRIFETGWIPGDTTTPEEMAPNRPRRSVHGRQTPPPVFAEAPKPPKKKRRPADDLPPGIPDETEP